MYGFPHPPISIVLKKSMVHFLPSLSSYFSFWLQKHSRFRAARETIFTAWCTGVRSLLPDKQKKKKKNNETANSAISDLSSWKRGIGEKGRSFLKGLELGKAVT